MPVREWILENLRSPERFTTAVNWELLFGAVLWNIWLARNAVVFDSSSCLPNPIIQSSRMLVERTLQAYGEVRGNVRAGHTVAATIKWSPPEEGWYKLNTDGATLHVLRGANSVADHIAKLAIPGSNCVTYLTNPPPSIEPILQGDVASHLVSHDPLLYANRTAEELIISWQTLTNGSDCKPFAHVWDTLVGQSTLPPTSLNKRQKKYKGLLRDRRFTMYRTAASRLRALKGRTCRRVPARFSSSIAAATTSSSSGGLLNWFTGGQSKSIPPLDFPLPGVALPSSLPDFVEPGKTKITTLPNGLKIASETSANPAASIGLYVDCGSIYESPASFGVSHLLERMAFKSTTNRSHLRVVREVEAIGGNVQAAVSREQIGYTFDALKTHVPEMVELLIDCVRNPAFLDWEVNEQLQKMKEEIADAAKNPHGMLLEAIHSAGYSGALANPLLAPESAVNSLDSTVLEDFVLENFTASRMVLAASGVDHEELLSVAEPLLSDLSNSPRPQEPKSVYTGGDYRCQADLGDQTHFALAFELPGGWHKEKEAIILTVLQILMGGGGSFSAGGPGKGMYSRLYVRVLNQYPQVQSFSAFNSIYNHTSIFGIQASTGSDFAPTAVDVAVKELIAVATPGQVDQIQLDRAKQSTKSAILMNLESRMVASEDIGKQVLTYGERKPVEYFLKVVDEITPKDISSVAQKLLSSPLTMASYGNVITVPSYDSVSRKFK
ncbi:hypothetical protein V6N13_031140 [Hibiscus sabdariffa]